MKTKVYLIRNVLLALFVASTLTTFANGPCGAVYNGNFDMPATFAFSIPDGNDCLDDRLNVSGILNLNDAELIISFGSFVPPLGTTYTLFEYGELQGKFSNNDIMVVCNALMIINYGDDSDKRITITVVQKLFGLSINSSGYDPTASAVDLSPAQPGAISGDADVCPQLIKTYSIEPLYNVATYNWVVPAGWVITDGQGTASITVTSGNSGQNGEISVIAENNCGASDASILAVSVKPGTPAAPVANDAIEIEATEFKANWDFSTNATTYLLDVSTVNNFSSFVDSFEDFDVGNVTSTLVTGLNPLTTYYYRVKASNDCGTSNTSSTIEATTNCGTNVTFTYNGNSVTYGIIERGGKCWMDRNLGATQVPTSATDAAGYGHYFQWGRLDDGHQLSNSATTATLSDNINPGHSSFITTSTSPDNWLDTQNDDLWKKVNDVILNNPCPAGWRVPTISELEQERVTWGNNTPFTGSDLKWPAAGYRANTGGPIIGAGSNFDHWSSTVNGNQAWLYRYLDLGAPFPIIRNKQSAIRADARPVRCLRDTDN